MVGSVNLAGEKVEFLNTLVLMVKGIGGGPPPPGSHSDIGVIIFISLLFQQMGTRFFKNYVNL